MKECVITSSKRVENRQWIKVKLRNNKILQQGDYLYIEESKIWEVVGVLQHATDVNIRSAIMIEYLKDDIWEYFVKPIDHDELIAEGAYHIVHSI